MKPAIECQFRVEGQRQPGSVQHTHHLVTEVNGSGAVHARRVKPWCTNEDTRVTIDIVRLRL